MTTNGIPGHAIERWQRFHERWQAALSAFASQRRPEILPVSKGHSFEMIQPFLGFPGFPKRLGENYSDELEQKARVMPSLEWHYLGALQSRKMATILSVAKFVHGVSRVKELEILSKSRDQVRFFVQVRISNEEQKSGAEVSDVPRLIEMVDRLNLRSRFVGFMGMAGLRDQIGDEKVRKQFAQLRALRDQHHKTGLLSMGMSGDFELALQEGADLVRIGTEIFGPRI